MKDIDAHSPVNGIINRDDYDLDFPKPDESIAEKIERAHKRSMKIIITE